MGDSRGIGVGAWSAGAISGVGSWVCACSPVHVTSKSTRLTNQLLLYVRIIFFGVIGCPVQLVNGLKAILGPGAQ